MRISISAYGVVSSTTYTLFEEVLNQYSGTVEEVVSSFKTIRNKTYSLVGGVGNLQGAVDSINARITSEESIETGVATVKKKAQSFIALAKRVDSQVATLVTKNKNEFYNVNPWLKPKPPEREKNWLEKAGEWLSNAGKAIAEGFKKVWEGLKEGFEKIGKAIGDFYNKYKKIIDTVLIVVGAVAAIAAVVATGGVALAPLLGALGCSAGVAAGISTAVAVTAVVSTVISSGLNIADVWGDFDNPVFNAFQKTFNGIAFVTNTVYSVGNIYNSVKGVSGKEYLARENAKSWGEKGYSNLDPEHPRMKSEPGADYSQAKKKAILEENRRRNGGVLRSDKTGKILEEPMKSTKGVKPSPYEAQVDHSFPKSQGGYNSFGNAQVIEREANIIKSNTLGFDDYLVHSKPDMANWGGFAASSGQSVVSESQNYKYAVGE